MTEEDIITNLKKNRRQARQLCPNAMVVSWEQAKKAIHKAYQEGANSGVETTVAATQKTVCYDKENISDNYSESECRAAETFVRDSRQ